mgnify:CR=1 FL=1
MQRKIVDMWKVREMMALGIPKVRIAQNLGISPRTLFRFLRQRKLSDKELSANIQPTPMQSLTSRQEQASPPDNNTDGRHNFDALDEALRELNDD